MIQTICVFTLAGKVHTITLSAAGATLASDDLVTRRYRTAESAAFALGSSVYLDQITERSKAALTAAGLHLNF